MSRWIGIVGLAAVACGGSASLHVDRAQYAPGDHVTLRLQNDGLGSVVYNLCPSTLVSSDGQVFSPLPPGAYCAAIGYALDPFQSVTDGLDVPADLPPGTYRVRTSIGLMSSGNQDLYTETFSVTSPP
jgi:hypothetical protein